MVLREKDVAEHRSHMVPREKDVAERRSRPVLRGKGAAGKMRNIGGRDSIRSRGGLKGETGPG